MNEQGKYMRSARFGSYTELHTTSANGTVAERFVDETTDKKMI